MRGDDRPGLVNRISDCAISHGANWADSALATFAGQFCGAIHLEAEDAKAPSLIEALLALNEPTFKVDAARVSRAPMVTGRTLVLDLIGNDRPGIVNAITSQLALLGANIQKMNTVVSSAPMSGDSLFSVHAVIMLNEDADVNELRKSLEGLADELMVDLSLASDK